jgi:predicted transcriptional regulator
MSRRITITVDESIYEMLEASAKESMRPIAVEAVYRIKLGLGEGRPILTQEQEERFDRMEEAGVIKRATQEEIDEDFKKWEESAGEVIEKVNKRLEKVSEDKESMKSLEKLVKNGVVKKGVKELPSQDIDGLKTFFKEKRK